jgi:NAD(P)-dependent dehydrogenase (short-subunit alcohol dehydrogenase family)
MRQEDMPAVLITGAGRGFGRAVLEEYLGRGWTAFPLVRDTRVAESLSRAGSHPIVADVASSEADGVIAAALDARGEPLDLLVNNAGSIRKLRGLASTEPEDLEGLFRVHCIGALRCTKAALPWLRRATRPLVVNVTSRFGSIERTAAGEFRGIYSYNVAKAAQNMLTACLDQELRAEGIRVFAVHPGRLRTSVGAADADTEPEAAARALADWVERIDRDAPCACHDLMGGGVIEW